VVRTGIASLAVLLVACNQAELVVVEAEQIGTVARSEWIQGRDGGGSAHAFGRSVWVYGDTVLEMEAEDGTNWHTNSYDLALPESWMTGFETPSDSVGAPRYFVELTAEERAWNDLHANGEGEGSCAEPPCGVRWALWPSNPQFDATRNRAWIFYGLYNDELPSGIGIASWDGLDQPVVRRKFGDSYLLFPAPETEWGAGMVIDDDLLYAFGCRLDFLARPCMIGRVPLEDPSDRSTSCGASSWRGPELEGH
jgi:hypothetical protein